jgi:hypothetical protein
MYNIKENKKKNKIKKNRFKSITKTPVKEQTVFLPKFKTPEHHLTNTPWNIYAQDKMDEDFTNESYKQCFTIKTLEDMWIFFNGVNDFSRHQFYIMRNDIAPQYEVPENINGGTCSYIVDNLPAVTDTLIELTVRAISENLVSKKNSKQITGIYMNPKKHGANIKIWVQNYNWLKENIH